MVNPLSLFRGRTAEQIAAEGIHALGELIAERNFYRDLSANQRTEIESKDALIAEQRKTIQKKDDQIVGLIQAQVAAEVHLEGFMSFSEGARGRMVRGRTIAAEASNEIRTAATMAKRFAPEQPQPEQQPQIAEVRKQGAA